MRPNAHVSWQFVLGNLKKVRLVLKRDKRDVEICLDGEINVIKKGWWGD